MPETTLKDYNAAILARDGLAPLALAMRRWSISVDQKLQELALPMSSAAVQIATGGDGITAAKQRAATLAASLQELLAQWPTLRDQGDDAVASAGAILPTILHDLPPPPAPVEGYE